MIESAGDLDFLQLLQHASDRIASRFSQLQRFSIEQLPPQHAVFQTSLRMADNVSVVRLLQSLQLGDQGVDGPIDVLLDLPVLLGQRWSSVAR